MDKSVPCPTPMVVGRTLTREDPNVLSDPLIYRRAIGALQYVTQTRLGYATSKLSQYLHCPSVVHWRAVKRIFRYLQGTKTHGILLQSCPTLQLYGYSDADWAVSLEDRKSMGAYCVFFGNSFMSWSSKKQHTVSRSSTESEYRALAKLAAEVLWIRSLLQEISYPLNATSVLWCDNLSSQALATNPVLHSRSKHIEIDLHFIRDKIASRVLEVRYVPSSDQLADCLTKSLSHSSFISFRNKLGVHNHSHPSLRGNVKSTTHLTDKTKARTAR